MKIHLAKILVWNGLNFQIIDFKQAQTQESLGSVIREYVAAMDLRLVYWCKV
ncbi:hypothetical protein HRE53_30970 (plasmid) [Acaryochloris sp. 'Moss Beach']|uniref:hypothetical protein n=1 Tax=Acaryochloris sp. 'Moss Beach' TaxID=2740837 RepID=UPI001F34F1AF|nr:hypothetical protein [Acaryochloris sp. 'Moss Beach']UJB73133.1 hypothetical protein HRE53_30970 [Acaryochloris sp. 'Moss Beach']